MVWPKFKNKFDSETFANIAEDLRKRAQLLPIDATVTSTIRTPEYNKSVGGVANSQHLTGGALDYRIRDLPPAKVALLKKHFTDAGFQVINEGDHLHVQRAKGAATNIAAPLQDPNKLPPLVGRSGLGPLRQGYKTAQLSAAMFPDLGGFGLAAMRGAGQSAAKMINTGIDAAAFMNPMNQGAMLSRALGIPGSEPMNTQQEILNNLFKSTLKKASGTAAALASGPTEFERMNTDPLLQIGGHTILPSAGTLAYGLGAYAPEVAMTAYGAGPMAADVLMSRLPAGMAPAVAKSLSNAAATSAGAFTGGMLKGEPKEAYINALTFPAMQLGMEGAGIYAKQAGKYLRDTPFLKNEVGTIGGQPKGGLPGEVKPGQIIGPDDAKQAVPRATVPETFSTLLAQIESAKAGLSKAVLITPGEVVPTIPKGLVTQETSAGTFIFDPTKISSQTIQRKVKNGSFGELLGHVEPKSATTTQAVAAVNPVTGQELKTSMASPQNVAKQSEILQGQFPQAQVINGGNDLAAKVLEQRQLATTPPIGGGIPPASGGSIPPIEPEIPGNLNFINKMVGPDGAPIPETQRAELINVATQYADDITKQKRGVRTWAQTAESAKELLADPHQVTVNKFLNAKPGTAFNADEVEAGISALTHYSKQIAELRNKVALNPDDLALKEALKDNLAMLSKMQPNVMSGATEMGRGLNIFKKLKQAIDPVESIRWKVLQGLNPDQVDLLAIQMAKAGDNPIAQMKVLSEFANKTWLDKWIEYSTAVKLYSPTTVEINATSNLVNGMLLPVENLVGAGVNKIESGVRGTEQTMFAKSAFSQAYGMARAIPRALGNFGKALLDEDFQLGEQRASEAVFGHAIKGVKGQVIRTSFRILNAFDALQRTINTSGQLTYMASNEGMRQGLKGKALTDFIESFIQSPPLKYQEAANKVASEYLLQSDLGSFSKEISKLLQSKNAKGLRIVQPFFKTPVNESKFGLQRSLLGFLSPRNLGDIIKGTAEERALAMSRIAIGSAFGLSAVTYAISGGITGDEPKDIAERAQWQREGKTKDSIKIGNSWYPFKRFGGVIAANLAIAASMADSWKRRGQLPTSEMISNMVGNVARQTFDRPYLQGIQQIMQAIQHGSGSKLAASFIGGQVPSIIGHVARAIDPIQRDPETVGERLQANIPIISQDVPPALNEIGQEVKKPGTVYSRLFGLSVSKSQDNSPLGKMLSDLGVGKTALFGQSPMGVELPKELYVKTQKEYGNKVKNILDKIAEAKVETVKDLLNNSSIERAKFYLQFIPDSVSHKKTMTGKKSDYVYSDYLYSKQGLRDFVQGIITSVGGQAADSSLRTYLPTSAAHIQNQFLIDQLKSAGPNMRMWKVKELKDKGLFTPQMQKFLDEKR